MLTDLVLLCCITGYKIETKKRTFVMQHFSNFWHHETDTYHCKTISLVAKPELLLALLTNLHELQQSALQLKSSQVQVIPGW